jgi:hypothetical protein
VNRWVGGLRAGGVDGRAHANAVEKGRSRLMALISSASANYLFVQDRPDEFSPVLEAHVLFYHFKAHWISLAECDSTSPQNFSHKNLIPQLP